MKLWTQNSLQLTTRIGEVDSSTAKSLLVFFIRDLHKVKWNSSKEKISNQNATTYHTLMYFYSII